MPPFYPPWQGPVNPYYPGGNPNIYVPPQHQPPPPSQPHPGYWPPPVGWDGNPAHAPVQPNTAFYPPQPDLRPSEFKSQRYPTLSAILAVDSTLLRFNVTNKPSREILTSTYYTYRHLPANTTPVRMMRLVSKSFPWTIDIPSQHDITCEMVWDALWAALQEPLADSEWGLICCDEKRMVEMKRAHKKRLEGGVTNSQDKRVKRCDYLGVNVWFRGLEKDEEYQRLRLLPGGKECPDTWTVALDSK